jgi:hypothetical protein
MDKLITTIEIALIILLPLIRFYQRSTWTYKSYILNIILLYLIWLFSYAILHELCHMLGSWITGAKILDYQLIPPYWKGDFKTAYINSHFENDFQAFVSGIFPYFRDIVFSTIGFLILKRKGINNSFFIGLIFILFILSPLYDIVNNYLAFVLGALNDFNGLAIRFGHFFTNTIGILFTSITIIIMFGILKIYKNYPEIVMEK